MIFKLTHYRSFKLTHYPAFDCEIRRAKTVLGLAFDLLGRLI